MESILKIKLIRYKIFLYFQPEELICWRMVNHNWKKWINDDNMWVIFCKSITIKINFPLAIQTYFYNKFLGDGYTNGRKIVFKNGNKYPLLQKFSKIRKFTAETVDLDYINVGHIVNLKITNSIISSKYFTENLRKLHINSVVSRQTYPIMDCVNLEKLIITNSNITLCIIYNMPKLKCFKTNQFFNDSLIFWKCPKLKNMIIKNGFIKSFHVPENITSLSIINSRFDEIEFVEEDSNIFPEFSHKNIIYLDLRRNNAAHIIMANFPKLKIYRKGN